MQPESAALPAVKEQLSTYWSAHAPAYERHQIDRESLPGMREAWESVWSQALPEPPLRVLDVGTGSGNVALRLHGLGYEVTGIDLAEGMLDQARRKAAELTAPPRFLTGDAVQPPFEARSFDAITARYVLWTLPDIDSALRAWQHLLAPGGVLVAVDSPWYPDGVAAVDAEPGDERRDERFRAAYTDDVLSHLPLAEASSIEQTAERLRAAGFVDVTVTALPELRELDERYGVPPGHRVQLQYRLTARVA